MSEWMVYLLAIVASLAITAPIALMLHQSMLAKNAAMNYFTRRALDAPPPPPRPPGKGCSAEEAATYFEEAAEWDKRFTAYCAKYPV